MRGKEVSRRSYYYKKRITPAYAGKRDREIVAVFIVWDHPRLCGEKKRFAETNEGDDYITPAYAGKRSGYFGFWSMIKDHPRLCGEKENFMDPVCV